MTDTLHVCQHCKQNFACVGKSLFATKWQPCNCLKDWSEEQEQETTQLEFFCQETCQSHHQLGRTDVGEEEDSEDSDSDQEQDNHRAENLQTSK